MNGKQDDGRIAVQIDAEIPASFASTFAQADKTIEGFSTKWKTSTSGLVVPASFQAMDQQVQKTSKSFESFGRFTHLAANQLGVGLAGGAISAAKALSDGAAAASKAAAGMGAAATAGTALKGVMAFIGGPVGLAVVAAFAAIAAGTAIANKHYEKKIELLEKIGEKADEATKRLKAFNENRTEASQSLAEIEAQASAARTGGKAAADRVKEMQEMQREAKAFGEIARNALKTEEEVNKAVAARYALLLQERDARKDLEKSLAAEEEALKRIKEQEESIIRNLNIQNQLRIDAFNQRQATKDFLKGTEQGAATGSVPWWANPDVIKTIQARVKTSEQTLERLINARLNAEEEADRAKEAWKHAVDGAIANVVSSLGDGAAAIALAIQQSIAGLVGNALGPVWGAAAGVAQGALTALGLGGPMDDAQKVTDAVGAYQHALDRLAEAQAAGSAVTTQQRERELELAAARSEAERAVIRQIHALEDERQVRDAARDAVRSTADALVDAIQRFIEEAEEKARRLEDLNIELARVSGDDELARELERARRLADATSEEEQALLELIFAREDERRAIDEQARAVEEQTRAAEEAQRAAEQLANALADAASIGASYAEQIAREMGDEVGADNLALDEWYKRERARIEALGIGDDEKGTLLGQLDTLYGLKRDRINAPIGAGSIDATGAAGGGSSVEASSRIATSSTNILTDLTRTHVQLTRQAVGFLRIMAGKGRIPTIAEVDAHFADQANANSMARSA